MQVGERSFESIGSHFSKKVAEQSAASVALQNLTVNVSQATKQIGINWKAKLQDYCQRCRIPNPEYSAKSYGPDHLKNWHVTGS